MRKFIFTIAAISLVVSPVSAHMDLEQTKAFESVSAAAETICPKVVELTKKGVSSKLIADALSKVMPTEFENILLLYTCNAYVKGYTKALQD